MPHVTPRYDAKIRIEPAKQGKHNRKTTLNAMVQRELNDMICKKSLRAYDFYNSFEKT